MKEFEYNEFVLRKSALMREANSIGQNGNGWELVCIISRREIPGKDPYTSESDELLTFLAKREKTTST